MDIHQWLSNPPVGYLLPASWIHSTLTTEDTTSPKNNWKTHIQVGQHICHIGGSVGFRTCRIVAFRLSEEDSCLFNRSLNVPSDFRHVGFQVSHLNQNWTLALSQNSFLVPVEMHWRKWDNWWEDAPLNTRWRYVLFHRVYMVDLFMITWSHNNVHRSVKLTCSHALQPSSYGRIEATIYLLECHVSSWWGCTLDTLVVRLFSKKLVWNTTFFLGGVTIKNVSMRMGITIPGTIYRLLQVFLWTIVTMRIPKIWMMF